MTKVLIIVLMAFSFSSLFAQKERSGNKATADKLKTLYNNEQFDSIYHMFSNEMKAALPLDATKSFFNDLKSGAGNINEMSFERYESSYASYKTIFERGIFTINVSVDGSSKVNGLYVRPYVENSLPKPARNTTQLILPFKEQWTVVWGGDTKDLNYHVENEAQKNAFDLVITDEKGRSFKTTGQTNEDYYAFGKELIAPCDAEVVLVVDGIKDNKPGVMNPIYIPGNTVILKTSNNEYLFFAHFKQHSIKVKQGQKVKRGDVLGLCGNSGNSSEPHLHFHIQNTDDMNIATGIKCYFESINVNGTIKKDYSPVKGEKIKN